MTPKFHIQSCHISTHLAELSTRMRNRQNSKFILEGRGGGHRGWQEAPAASGVRNYTARELWDFFRS